MAGAGKNPTRLFESSIYLRTKLTIFPQRRELLSIPHRAGHLDQICLLCELFHAVHERAPKVLVPSQEVGYYLPKASMDCSPC